MPVPNPTKGDFQSSSTTSLSRPALHVRLLTISTAAAALLSQSASAFTFGPGVSSRHRTNMPHTTNLPFVGTNKKASSTELQVKWFGGGSKDYGGNRDELLNVKIEKTSSNSRRIAGEIIVSKPLDDVWAILTDYDNLSVHVPNLVESNRVGPTISPNNEPGDGNYKCRLYQKGAQKIIGFEFGASVTMDMTENVRMANVVKPRLLKLGQEKKIQAGEQRRIFFKCVDSKFFSEFDGEWKVSWEVDPNDAFELATKIEYVVDVRPRGPVPVQALEWRIREDVPTNLRAVKVASLDLGRDGVMKMREAQIQSATSSLSIPSRVSSGQTTVAEATPAMATNGRTSRRSSNFRTKSFATAATNTRRNVNDLVNKAASASKNAVSAAQQGSNAKNIKLAPVRVQWYDDETMATYLDKRN